MLRGRVAEDDLPQQLVAIDGIGQSPTQFAAFPRRAVGMKQHEVRRRHRIRQDEEILDHRLVGLQPPHMPVGQRGGHRDLAPQQGLHHAVVAGVFVFDDFRGVVRRESGRLQAGSAEDRLLGFVLDELEPRATDVFLQRRGGEDAREDGLDARGHALERDRELGGGLQLDRADQPRQSLVELGVLRVRAIEQHLHHGRGIEQRLGFPGLTILLEFEPHPLPQVHRLPLVEEPRAILRGAVLHPVQREERNAEQVLLAEFGIHRDGVGTVLSGQADHAHMQPLIALDNRFVPGSQVLELGPDGGRLFREGRGGSELARLVGVLRLRQQRETALLQPIGDCGHLRILGIQRPQAFEMMQSLRIVLFLGRSQGERLEYVAHLFAHARKVLLEGVEFFQRDQRIFQSSGSQADLGIRQQQAAPLLRQPRPVGDVLEHPVEELQSDIDVPLLGQEIHAFEHQVFVVDHLQDLFQRDAILGGFLLARDGDIQEVQVDNLLLQFFRLVSLHSGLLRFLLGEGGLLFDDRVGPRGQRLDHEDLMTDQHDPVPQRPVDERRRFGDRHLFIDRQLVLRLHRRSHRRCLLRSRGILGPRGRGQCDQAHQ